MGMSASIRKNLNLQNGKDQASAKISCQNGSYVEPMVILLHRWKFIL